MLERRILRKGDQPCILGQENISTNLKIALYQLERRDECQCQYDFPESLR